MKTGIYYFSATGNSFAVARDLAKELGGADVVPMTKALKGTAGTSYDRIGIVFPVYMFGLPLIVADFLRVVNIPKNAYVFAVATFGGIPGRSLALAKDILAKRGVVLSAGFGVLMPGNYTPLYGAIAEEKQSSMFEKEKARIKEIASAVLAGKKGIMEEKPFIANLLFYLALYHGGSSQIRGSDKQFWASDKCTKCGLCEKMCPVKNIELKEERPTWLHHCEHCMACLQWCPVEAIQYGKRTAGKKRYHHPGVTAVDIMAQQV